MEIREATNRDAPAVQALIGDVLADYGFALELDGYDHDIVDIEGFYGPFGGLFEVVVEDDGTICGTCGLAIDGDGDAELRKMYLARRLRGQGIGKRLLERAIAHARAAGCRRIVLDTSSKLTEAIALYRSYGFVPVEHEMPCRCDQAYALVLEPSGAGPGRTSPPSATG